MNLEFTTTACNRPGLLRQTYESFSENLRGVDFAASTVYINVDPQPGPEGRARCERVAREFFGEVVANYPDTADFSRATKWCWEQVEREYFFNLEDDWALNQPVHVGALLHTWDLAPGALQVVLRHSPKHGPHAIRDKPEYERIENPGLPPSLNRTGHLRDMIDSWDTDQNPEKWLRAWYHALESGPPVVMWPSRVVSEDRGRGWRAERDLRKEPRDRGPGQWKSWT